MIGLEVLRAASFTIDYEDRRIDFGPAPQYRNWVPFADGPPMITVEVEIDGKRKRLLVDTGAEGLFLFRDQDRKHQPPETAGFGSGSHVSLTRNRRQIELPDVRLGLRTWCSILSGDGWDGGNPPISITGNCEPCSWISPHGGTRSGGSAHPVFGDGSLNRGDALSPYS